MNGRSRPQGPAPKTPTKVTYRVYESTDTARQIRDRRTASYRLLPMPDGRRDVLETENTLVMESTSSLEARRRAWQHLAGLGLLDENTAAMLRGAA